MSEWQDRTTVVRRAHNSFICVRLAVLQPILAPVHHITPLSEICESLRLPVVGVGRGPITVGEPWGALLAFGLKGLGRSTRHFPAKIDRRCGFESHRLATSRGVIGSKPKSPVERCKSWHVLQHENLIRVVKREAVGPAISLC